jgi:transcriptional regulator with XRE-family HTH domain
MISLFYKSEQGVNFVLGDNIRKIRKSKKISINKLSKMTSISVGYLSDLENNKATNPSIEKLNTIAEALEVPTSELLTTEEKLEMATNSLKNIHDLVAEASEKYGIGENPINRVNKIAKENKIETLAAHFEDEDFTDDDVEDIENFIKFILSKKKK